MDEPTENLPDQGPFPQGGQQQPPPYGQSPPYGQPPPYGQSYGGAYGLPADPSAPFGREPATGLPYSDKSKTAAGLLQLLLPFVGICGIGRIMTGHVSIGVIQLIGMFVGYLLMLIFIGFIIVPVIWIWSFIDGILILSGNVKDSDGLPLHP